MRKSYVSGRESIWEYPRPPAVRPTPLRAQVIHASTCIADTTRALKVCETGHPPTFYFPPEDVRMELLEPIDKKTYCEWKGIADYFDLYVSGRRASAVAWTYREPKRGFESIRNYIAFYPAKVDRCLLDGEEAVPEPRAYYGGWITSHVDGPFR